MAAFKHRVGDVFILCFASRFSSGFKQTFGHPMTAPVPAAVAPPAGGVRIFPMVPVAKPFSQQVGHQVKVSFVCRAHDLLTPCLYKKRTFCALLPAYIY